MESKTIINITQASEILNVSQATVRNWIKTKLLPENLTKEDVENLKISIETGEIQKLNKRANKIKSNVEFIPSEYSTNQSIRLRIKKITDLTKRFFNNTDDTVYHLAICYLMSKREVFELFGFLEFERSIFQSIINSYGEGRFLNIEFLFQARPHFIKLDRLECYDALGLLYQSIKSEGNKSHSGSYYTPPEVSDFITSNLSNKVEIFFDPCCGTGSFLLSAARTKKLIPDNIYGTDIDKNAVFIAKINLLIHFRNSSKEPNIFCVDILNNSDENFPHFLKGKIDAIATNPPWGANKNENLSGEYKTLLNSNEIFSMFIAKSLEMVKEKGECAFLLPESILNIKTHLNIRKILATKTTILSIKEFGRAFTRVFTPVVSIHIKKQFPNFQKDIIIQTKTFTHEINQKRVINTKDHIFDINITTEEKNLIKKIYAVPHSTLKFNAKWALGVITGNNDTYISTEKTEENEPIYKGNDITYFRLNTPVNFIKYERDKFQQVAKEEFYRAKEKLIYKFISNKLVFAYDDKKSLTLNSANILIPLIPGYSIKSTIVFLNSSLFQFLFSKKFSTHKVLRSDLEQLPFPKLSPHYKKKLEELAILAITGEDIREKIDEIIFKLFELNNDEIKIIKNNR